MGIAEMQLLTDDGKLAEFGAHHDFLLLARMNSTPYCRAVKHIAQGNRPTLILSSLGLERQT
jgi:hypothetical protein